jgi:hypothetical protein
VAIKGDHKAPERTVLGDAQECLRNALVSLLPVTTHTHTHTHSLTHSLSLSLCRVR